MKRKFKKCVNVFLLLMLGMLVFAPDAFSQSGNITVRGNVKDNNNEPVISASVVVKGTTIGVMTDLDGNYEISNVPGNGVLVFSFLGYKTVEIPVAGKSQMDVVLEDNTALLDEVVVIGYGSVKKSDLSGSVVAIKAEEINKGAVTSPQQMLQGKVSGLFVQPGNGAPGSGSTIRIRSGASLSASNDPLIVIDGIPTSNDAAPGTPNALATINPNDIESFTVLKDASATAIYGSRASNGVIIITTKKGSQGKVKVSYSSTYSFSDPYKKIKTMNADEFYQAISTYYPQGTDAGDSAYELLNQYPGQRTDWQDAIFRTAFATDQNLSFAGTVGILPYRVSVGYTNEDGTLQTSNYERYTGSVSLSPKFFDDHLSVNINVKGTINNNTFADAGAVSAAAFYDPTKPIYDETGYHGYWNHMQGTNANKLAPNNPVSMLYDVENAGKTKRSLGNIQLDYKFHFLPELRANLNLGYDVATSTGHNGPTVGSFQAAKDSDLPDVGRYTSWNNLRRNQLLDFYLNYNKYFESIKSNVDVMG
ncbi:MAG: SusC/RagA family TonB-linked outer membrane protein, partial [Bacteroides xylanisolvens]